MLMISDSFVPFQTIDVLLLMILGDKPNNIFDLVDLYVIHNWLHFVRKFLLNKF